MHRRAFGLFTCLLTLAAIQRPARAETVEELPPRQEGVVFLPQFGDHRFERPLWVGSMPGRPAGLVIAEQAGRVLFCAFDSDARDAEILLDLRDSTRRRHNEEGLLGLAFHPQFQSNGELYVHSSRSDPRRGTVSRYRFDRDQGRFLVESEELLLEVEQPWGNHNGGELRFGPDGYLYVSFGDGGAAADPLGSGQDLSTLLGSIVRIDVDHREQGRPYGIPADNPFVADEAARPEIYAYGLRNVWRFSFDRATGELWGGDVGQDRFEEIDRIVAGGNYGWNLREGHHAFRGGDRGDELLEPVVDYTRRLARCITGGFVYRGAALPQLEAAYLHGDYETGYVWALREGQGGAIELVTLGRVAELSSFGEDEAGELYLSSLRGKIYRMVGREDEAP